MESRLEATIPWVSRSEEHTSGLQARDLPSFPTRRSSHLLGLKGEFEGVLELTEYLRLSDNHGIEARSHDSMVVEIGRAHVWTPGPRSPLFPHPPLFPSSWP